MRLRGITFPPVMNASGAQGFFGEGYPFHRFWKLAGLTFKGCGFIAKTTTLDRQIGHMPVKDDGITPKEWKPKCIVVKPLTDVVLNSVGLTGPGAGCLFSRGHWQCRRDPFFLSFMSIQKSADERQQELKQFVQMAQHFLGHLHLTVGLEMNFSCPNVGLDPGPLVNEIGEALDEAGRLRMPLQVKLNALMPVTTACEIARHPECDAITMGNTIPWGKLPERINWLGLFGSTVSPLAHLGGGGLSGWPLLPIICDWLHAARDCGLTKPVWACGGINSPKAVHRVKAAGASGIQFGTAALLHPDRMRSIIGHAHAAFPS